MKSPIVSKDNFFDNSIEYSTGSPCEDCNMYFFGTIAGPCWFYKVTVQMLPGMHSHPHH